MVATSSWTAAIVPELSGRINKIEAVGSGVNRGEGTAADVTLLVFVVLAMLVVQIFMEIAVFIVQLLVFVGVLAL